MKPTSSLRPRAVRTALALVVTTAGLFSPIAAAEDSLVLGGGAGIVVAGSNCTLTAIGHDKNGDLVGFTAAHCGGPGSQVVAEGADAHGPVGQVAVADGDLDYSVIKFDPATVIPTANFGGFAINGIGPDPSFGQPACTRGAASGDGCGSIRVQTLTPGVMGASLPSWNPGDDGEPVTVDGQLVGVTRHGITMSAFPEPRVLTHITFTLFSAILNDTNAKGGAGAGFTPV